MRPMNSAITRELPNMDTSVGQLVTYEPGNSTKYKIYFQKLGSMISESMGLGIHGAHMITFLNVPNKPTLLLSTTSGYLSLNYFMEKTGLSEGDAVPLVALISERLGFDRRTS